MPFRKNPLTMMMMMMMMMIRKPTIINLENQTMNFYII